VATDLRRVEPARAPRWWVTWLDPKLIVPLIQAVVVLLVGWWIKDGVTVALQQKQLDLANVKEMRELVHDLLKPSSPTPEDYQSAAIALAPFGRYTIGTFLQLIKDPANEQQLLAAESGLRAVAVTEPQLVEEQLRRVIRNRTGFYPSEMHIFAIRTLGQMDDVGSLPDLASYRKALRGGASSDTLQIFRSMVSDTPGNPQLNAIIRSLDESIAVLTRTKEGQP
jgi:hypothetical protein